MPLSGDFCMAGKNGQLRGLARNLVKKSNLSNNFLLAMLSEGGPKTGIHKTENSARLPAGRDSQK